MLWRDNVKNNYVIDSIGIYPIIWVDDLVLNICGFVWARGNITST